LREALEQIPDRAIGGKAFHSQQSVQGAVRPQHPGVRKAPCSRHHRDQKRRERFARIDGIRRFQMHRQVLAYLLAIADLLQKLHKHTQPSERRHRPRRLLQNHFLFPPKRVNFSMHCSVPPQILFNQLQSNGLERNSAP